MKTSFNIFPLLLSVLIIPTVFAETVDPERPDPCHADVSYGPHAAQVLDFWQAKSDAPTPLVIYIHGGGFRKGDKAGLSDQALRKLLPEGISVASINYRMLPEWKLPIAHQDGARALQFLRSKAKEWNIDPERVGAFGGSAGAQICMWLAFTTDMAKADSTDPIERHSTRLKVVAPASGQATLDMDLWDKWLPKIKQVSRNHSNASWPGKFEVDSWEEAKKVIDSISAINLITADDPPVYMSYNNAPGDPLPAEPKKAQSIRTHHVNFGLKLKEKLDSMGVENYLHYPGNDTPYPRIEDFFIKKLTGTD